MKKSFMLLSLLMLSTFAIGITSCGSNNSSTNNDSNVSSNLLSESVNNSSTSNVTYTFEQVLNKLKEGYQSTSLLEFTYDPTSYSGGSVRPVIQAQYIRNTIGTDVLKSEISAIGDDTSVVPTYVQSFHIQKGDNDLPVQATLSFNNTLVTKTISNTTWSNSYYSNVFKSVELDDFVKEEDESYSLKAKSIEQKQKLNKFASQFVIATLPIQAKSFNLSISNDYVFYTFNFDSSTTVQEGYEVSISITGEISLKNTGKDLVSKVDVINGEEDLDFKKAIDSLKTQNWEFNHVDERNYDYSEYTALFAQYGIEIPSSVSVKQVDEAKSNNSDFLVNSSLQAKAGDKTQESSNNYLFRQTNDGLASLVNGVDFYNKEDFYYTQAPTKDYTLASILPSFSLSSLVFEKETVSNTILKFTPNLNLPLSDDTGYLFSAFGDQISSLENFSIEIDTANNTVKFNLSTNGGTSNDPLGIGSNYNVKIPYTSNVSIIYSKFGEVSNTLVSNEKIHENTDNLSLKSFAAPYYEDEKQAGILNTIISLDNLSYIPTLGGYFISLDEFGVEQTGGTDENPIYGYLGYELSSKEKAEASLESYKEKLIGKGFKESKFPENPSISDNVWYGKTGFTNQATYTLVVGEGEQVKTIYVDVACETTDETIKLKVAVRTQVITADSK